MARTIESPGVEIREVDLSLRASLPVGTKVLLHGFAAQGPTNELIQVSTRDELEQIFFAGAGPTNAAERYFYHSAKEILNSPATLYVTRMPYGSGDGTGFDGEYTALAYPMSGYLDDPNTYVDFNVATGIKIGPPVVIPLTESDYLDLKSGQITWTNVAGGALLSSTDLGNAGMIIVNDAKTTINEKYEGYYVVIADQSTITDTISNGYNSVMEIQTLSSNNSLRVLSNNLLGFTLTGDAFGSNPGNISEVVETSQSYDFADSTFADSVIMYIFRLRTSPYASDPNKLYYVPAESYAGSLEATDQRTNPVNGLLDTFYLANKVNGASNYVQMFVNSNIANTGIVGNLSNDESARKLNPIGSFTPCKDPNSDLKFIGSLPSKVTRALALAENIQSLDIDIVPTVGLETVWAYAADASGGTGAAVFDEMANVAVPLADLADPDTGDASDFAKNHRTIFNLYNNFCQQTRKDCITYSDPIRGIFIQGEKFKTLDRKDRNFTQHIYTPIRNLYVSANSNYAATYANWINLYDDNSGKYVWIPFSGWQTAITARMDANLQPWYAPFGLNNGLVRNVTDIALRTNQKQQDAFYRIGVNPVVFFQGDGFVVWGQKTTQSKPSAFDRINVRRLFLVLERATLKVLRYFVAEPNTVFTRTRVVNVLKPIFDLAKNNEGLYDYLIVCDERNNTPNVIDNNEMHVDIYLKPVRTAEFILVTFFATRTDQDFNELVG